MVIVKATKSSGARVRPSEELLTAMGKYNEEPTKNRRNARGRRAAPEFEGRRLDRHGLGGGEGGYALAREFLTVRKSQSVSFRDAAVLRCAFLSAFKSLYGTVGVDVPHIVRRHVIQFFKR
jgi:hypothetical protein